MVTIGIDTHKATLAVSAVDEAGRERGAETFANDGEGHARLLRWARRHGPERRFGIEGSGSFGAALARLLVAADERAGRGARGADRSRAPAPEPGRQERSGRRPGDRPGGPPGAGARPGPAGGDHGGPETPRRRAGAVPGRANPDREPAPRSSRRPRSGVQA